jgi:CheY-like chemotaxis protein
MMLERLIGPNVRTTLSLGAGVGNIHADPCQIEQVLLNLALNARDAMPHGGRLFIETRPVVVDENFTSHCLHLPFGEYALISVTDTGSGMTPEVQDRIFEPFFTTKQERGTGLGLSVVHGIVRQSGGEVLVHSAPGVGTTFRLSFPSVKDTIPVEYPQAIERDLSGSETILVADDEDEIRRYLVGTLARNGYRALAAASGSEAIAIAEAYPDVIHVLLSDIVMPGINGIQLAREIGALRQGIRVLFMSGLAGAAVEPADAESICIEKPFGPLTLLRQIRTTLDGGCPRALPVSGAH